MLQKCCYPEPGAGAGARAVAGAGAVAGTGAGQDWTGSTTLVDSQDAGYGSASDPAQNSIIYSENNFKHFFITLTFTRSL